MNTKGTKSLLRIASVVFVIGTSILGGSGCSKEDANQYAIIDLSAGANAQAYPVTWLKTIPEGGWTDEYKTTKLVLRRIAPGTFKMGSSEDEQGRGKKNTTEKRHSVTLTRPFYMGVFEVTQKQWELVMGTRPSAFCREKYYTMRPVEQVSYDMIRGENNGSQWPLSAAVDADSFIGRLRSRTNLAGLDLPTEAQWEYACRGSATNTALNCGLNLKRIVKDGEATDDYKLNSIITNVSDIARCWAKDVKKPEKKEHGRTFVFERAGCYGDLGVYDTSKGTAIVGSFPPNSFGLYDMHGNVGEWCLDAGSPYPEDAVQDPLGDEPSTIDVSRMARGGGWRDDIENCRSANRLWLDPSRDHDSQGLRVCYMADPYKGSAPVAVNKVPPKKITKLKGISIGELIPSVLKDCMKYKEYDFTTPKSCQYIANEEDLDGEAKSFFLKSDWLTGVEIDIVPGTKEVFDIQVSYGAEDEEEADAKADALATIVQEDLGIVFKKNGHTYSYGTKDNWCKVIPSLYFSGLNSDSSSRKPDISRCVRVTIHDETLIASLKEEAKDKESKGKKKLPRSLVSILGIAPSEQDDGKVENLDGVFGKIFGEKIDSTEKNNTGSVVKTFTIEDEPLGFKEGVIFGTPKTHQTYMIRAVFAQSDLKDAYNAAKKLFGDVIGMEFTKGAGKTHVCRPKNSRGTCMIEVIEEDDRVFIDITDLTLYKLVEEEKNGDTFGFIPRIRKGVDPKEIKGVFGRELGCSVAYMETELNDNGALVATINPDENDFGFDAFRLFATPKTKKTFMIRAAYTGSDIDDKRTELVMTLKKMLGKSPSLDKSGDWYFIMPGGTGKNVLIQVEKNDDVLFMDVTDFALHETYNSEKE